MVADEQPIICDGFSSTGDAVVSGNPSSNGETEGGSDAGAAVGVTFAVIVARHVGSAPFNYPSTAYQPPSWWCHSAPLAIPAAWTQRLGPRAGSCYVHWGARSLPAA
eukprot:scaffold102284_cov48-Phaeocystis_antarctica.AAC.1